jgi:hypothetical protein
MREPGHLPQLRFSAELLPFRLALLRYGTEKKDKNTELAAES